jgi:hypothetical protein
MDLPEETPKPEEPKPSEETFPEEPILPEGFTPIGEASRMNRVRRRRAQRTLLPSSADERATLLSDLARRAFPSFEFFLFAFLGGTVIGASYLLDAPALLLLGILLLPLLTPWVGLTLSAITGSWRYFFQMLGGFLVAVLLVFMTGALAGLAGRLWQHLPLFQANLHSHLWWPDLLLVILGAVLLVISFVRSEQRPVLPSIMLAYGLFLPVSAAGFGLGNNVAGLWPNGLLVFLVYLALSILVGGITLAAMRFKPLKASGYILPVLLGLLSLVVLLIFTGLIDLVRNGITTTRTVATQPTPTTFVMLSPTAIRTSTPTATPTITLTSSATPTATPPPSYAVIDASFGGGAWIRTQPGGGTAIIVIQNGTLVQTLPEIQTTNFENWVHIRLEDGMEGWILQGVLKAATPTPTSSKQPTLTYTVTLTPKP